MFLLKLIIFLIVFAIAVSLSIKTEERERGNRPGGGSLIRKKFTVVSSNTLLSLVLVIGALIILPAVGTVPTGYRGVVLKFGAFTGKVLDEGIYLVMPVAERVELMSVQIIAYAVEAESASKDLQDVRTQVTLNYCLDSSSVGKVYQTLRRDYQNRIISPAIQESVKAATAQFEAGKLVTERPLVKAAIEENLKTRLAAHGIFVDAVSITDFKFSRDFTAAIEAKVTATQLAEKALRDLERIKTEAQQKIESAKAEAESLRIQKEQVTSQLIQLRQIEVQKIAVEKWNGVLPTTVTSGAPVPILDVFGKK